MKSKTAVIYFKMSKYAFAFILFWGFSIIGCEGRCRTNEAIKSWEMYVKFIKTGNEEKARQFWAEESQAYFNLESECEKNWLDHELTVVKSECNNDLVKIQLIAERDGKQKGFFTYMIKVKGEYFLQYPFLIFAQSWPIASSQHFKIHSMFLPESKEVKVDKDVKFPDTTILEEFLVKINKLTGIQFHGSINYYYCQDRDEVAKLTGQREGLPRYTIGSCAITMEKYSFAAIMDIATKGHVKPIDLLYYGLLGYSELERARMEKGAIERANYTTAKYFMESNGHPLLSLVSSSETKDNHERKANLWIIGGALVDFLITEGGEDRFRKLYKSSRTELIFEDGISTIYGTSLETLEKRLKDKYRKQL
ncbi:MAG: hypothetical protein GF311_00500 [Candidatus Lokiarchaeota archaeon]|nr:hypothetical protein [Candidatus Lokiarchaeota archaeon]